MTVDALQNQASKEELNEFTKRQMLNLQHQRCRQSGKIFEKSVFQGFFEYFLLLTCYKLRRIDCWNTKDKERNRPPSMNNGVDPGHKSRNCYSCSVLCCAVCTKQ